MYSGQNYGVFVFGQEDIIKLILKMYIENHLSYPIKIVQK